MRLFAVDPGIATGWARADLDLELLRRYGGDIAKLVMMGGLLWEAGEDNALSGRWKGADPYKMDRHELYYAERMSASRLWERMEGVSGMRGDGDEGGLRGAEGAELEEGWPWSEEAAIGWEGGGCDLLVIEDFTVYAGKAGEVAAGGAVPLAPVRVGSMLAMAAEIGVIEVQYQMASMAKTTVTDERLKRWDLWTVGSAHARDATRHLVTYVRRMSSSLGGAR